MDPVKSSGALFLALVGLTILQQVCSQHVYVAAPNTFRVGEKETVVVYSHSGVQEVTVSMADCPGKKKVFFTKTLNVVTDAPQIIEVKVNPDDIPELNITGPLEPHYVFLMVKGKTFSKESKVLVTMQSGYIFIQTDKPIYNPSQPVNMRIIRLNEDMAADKTPFTLQIRNPQNTIVHSLPHKDLESRNGMYSTTFNFPNYPLYGEWSVSILYGLKVQLNSTVTFELRKYVLPTFEVKVTVPEVILPDDQLVTVSVLAEYVYGKKVDGKATIKLKVKIPTGHAIQFGSCDMLELFEGRAQCNFKTKEIQDTKKIGWFPGINGARLVVEALVYERSSGYKENKTIESTVFATTPHVITFGKSLTTYIPGLNTAIMAQINHVNGNPARNVEAIVTVRDQNNAEVALDTPDGVTNDEGLVTFVVKTKAAHTSLKVTVVTKGEKHPVSGHLVLFPYKAGNAYVGISRDSTLVRKVGESYTPSVYSHPVSDMPMSYLVISKGKIVSAGSLLQKGRHQRSLDFKITPEMVPSARVILFATYGNQLLTDSLKIRVEKICNPKGEVKVKVTSQGNVEPGNPVTIKITGEENTVVGILAVDKAVYALRNKDKLTRDKMFSEMDKHDMGCGAGGGVDSLAVLANAGVLMISDTLSIGQERKSCVERKLRKRAIIDDITRRHGKKNTKCCEAGQLKDIHGRTCEVRAQIVRNFEGKLANKEQCAKTFLACCLHSLPPSPLALVPKSDKPVFGIHGRSKAEQPVLDDVLDDELFEEILESTHERKDFKETWLFQVDVIGASKELTQPRNLPDSITTWIVQVVSLSTNGGGMCVAEPVEVVAFKKFFLDVRVPHSVVRNEQIEIPVTIFNYGAQTRTVFVFTYGVEGICSEAQAGQRGLRKKIVVKNNSAETVAFQMIPLEVKEFPITFSAISSDGGDTVTKILKVIAEGVAHEEFFPFAVDPSNTEKRKRRNIVSEKYEARFDNEKKKQLSIVKLQPEFEFIVPGTEYAVIEAIGDKFGTTIQTSLENPDSLLRLPRGCGEQNMAFMAPTVYTLHYLKATGKVTPQQETNAYKFIREGYNKQQTYRKADGSFSVWPTHPSSTWLTTFVVKVFCQSGRYVFVDENVVCSALKWLVTKQKPDGSFVESYNLHHKEMKGGINGDVPLTAFAVMAFTQCHCKSQELNKPVEKAVNYLMQKTATIDDHYRMAISTYALALYDTELAKEPNEKLLQMATYDSALNRRHWPCNGNNALSVEASSYGLMAQILFGDVDKATSIVNFLNTQRQIGGSFWSTQDTVAAIEALAEYAILSRDPDISLVMNITSTTDPNFKQTWQFQNSNARVRRQAQLTKLGGRLLVEAEGSGVGLFGVRLRYNIANSPDRPALCKFEVSVMVNVAKEIIKKDKIPEPAAENDFDGLLDALGVDEPEKQNEIFGRAGGILEKRFGNAKPQKEFNLKDILGDHDILNPGDLDEEPRMIFKRDAHDAVDGPEGRIGGAPKSSKYVLNVTVCSRYLRDQETNMVIVDVGMLTGFKPDIEELKELVMDKSSLIDRFEESGRNLIFYLEKIPQGKKHCFSFRIIRDFIASNLESGLVRVYDYYNPDDACSQFYRSESVGSALSVNCVGTICKCAEGGCPKDPTERIKNVKNLTPKRTEVTIMACNEHDYFFKVQVKEKKAEKSGYIHYIMEVVKVLKEGQEKREEMEGEDRKFVASTNCPTANLAKNGIYYLMGRDQEKRQEGDDVSYIYFIDKSSTVLEFQDLQRKDKKLSSQQKNLQHIFTHVEKKFISNEGCDD